MKQKKLRKIFQSIFLIVFLVLIFFLTKNINQLKTSFALYENISTWTDMLNKQLASMRNDPSQVKNDNTKARILLDAQYAGYAKKAVEQATKQNKDILDANIAKTQQLAQSENGTPKQTYYIEPNQFRKICDQNTYVLYSRIGGSSNRDLRNPKNSGGPAEGEESFWKVPTCSELAKCDCCINTCNDTVLRKIGKVWVTVCLPNVGFGPMGCSPACKAPIARGACSAYSSPSHEAAYDRDCMGRANGCEGGGGGCKIIIRDPNNSQFEYLEGGVWKKSHQGDNVVPEGTTVKKLNQINSLPPGWIGQLDPAPGKCCKCLQSP